MRRSIFLTSAVLLFAFLASAPLLHAQFKDATKAELQMTSDPKAPGSDAVYLYREDVTNQPARVRSFYERVKILTEKGKEMATVDMPFTPGSDKVEIEGRTIHTDGTIIPLTDKPADIAEVQSKSFKRNTMVFTLPSVEVGSILEYRVTVHYGGGVADPTWMIQQDEFVHEAHYAYRTSEHIGLSYASRIGSDATVQSDNKDTYWLDLTDIPALPNEDWMPPLNAIKWRVSFFFTPFPSTKEFWDSAQKVWADFVIDYTKPTSTLKSAVAEMTAPSDTETQKAQKIYAAVMKLENTDFTRAKTKVERKKEKIKDIHNAQDVWREQSGSSDELALLFVALGRAAGLNVSPMRVVDRSRALFDIGLLSTHQLDDYIVVAQLDGKIVYLDPGQQMCPFGMLHWKHTLATGFRLKDREVFITHTPSSSAASSTLQRIAELTVDESGNLHGTVRMVLGGQYALRWRQFSLENDEDEVKKSFNEWMKTFLPDGVQADFDHFLGIDEYDSNLIGIARIQGSLGTITGKHMFLPGLFFQSKAKHPFVVEEKRTTPVDVLFAKTELDDVTYHLPAAFKMESSPQVSDVAWPEHAKLNIATTADGESVNVTRNLACSYTILNAKEYGNLHDFYQKLAAADQQQLVLAKNAPDKGN